MKNEEWLREPKAEPSSFELCWGEASHRRSQWRMAARTEGFSKSFFCGQECPVIYRNFSEMFFLIIPGLFLIIPDQDKKWLELGDGTAGGAGDD